MSRISALCNKRSQQKQVNNAFLLNLNWEYACQWQIIKDKKNEINNLFKAFESELASDIFGFVSSIAKKFIAIFHNVITK